MVRSNQARIKESDGAEPCSVCGDCSLKTLNFDGMPHYNCGVHNKTVQANTLACSYFDCITPDASIEAEPKAKGD